MSDREFWMLIYRAVLAIAAAIKKKYIDLEKKTV
jgi:hypothetical protein